MQRREKEGKMNLQLERLRKEAGYRSRKSFAEAFGSNERQIKAWECGERKLRLEDACGIADFLHCTLDELAGRDFSPADYSDTGQAELNACYENMNPSGKEMLVSVARSMERDTANRIEKEGSEPACSQAEEVGA